MATSELDRSTALAHDQLVQSLVAASMANDLGRDDLLEEHLARALTIARQLATASIDVLLDLRDER